MKDKKVTQVADRSANIKKTEETMAKRKASFENMIEGTEAGNIWNEIKDRNIELFALPGQVISQHAAPVPVEPSKLYLLTKATSALPAIEAAIGPNYIVDRADKYVTVSRAIISPIKK